MQLVASSTRPNVEWRPLQIYLILQGLFVYSTVNLSISLTETQLTLT
jgi:hypothetical protein